MGLGSVSEPGPGLCRRRDVTDRKAAEALRRYARDLERAKAQQDENAERLAQLVRELDIARQSAIRAAGAKGEFLANMSHEIRTPMNAIMGMTDLVLRTRLTAQQRDYLRTARESAEALLTIINDILDVSKIEARRLTLDRTSFRLRDTVEDGVGSSPRGRRKKAWSSPAASRRTFRTWSSAMPGACGRSSSTSSATR